MGRVGRFVLGAVLIGASFLVPGASPFLIGMRAALLSSGISFASGAVFEALAGTQRRQAAIEINQPDNQSPLPVVYGEAKLGLRLVDMREGGSGNKFLYIVGALCHGSSDGNGIQAIDEIYFDNELAINAAGTVQGRFSGKVSFAKYLGTDAQSVDPTMNAAFATAWPTTSKGRGVAYIMLRLEADDEVFPTGIPNVTCIVRGCKVQDTRIGGAFVYSTNPALAVYDYMTSARYGLECATTELDSTSFNTEANYYDEVITKDGANTGKRFEINGWLDVGAAVQDNIRNLLTSCRGNLVFEGGKYRLFTRKVVTPTTFKLTEANIVGGWRFRTMGVSECPNIIRYTFIDPGTTDTFAAETKYWPRPGLSNTYLTDDNNYEVIADAELPMTTDKYTCEQIALVTLKEQRAGIMVELTATEAALQLVVGDLTPITHTTPGWVDKNFWIMGMFLLPTGQVRIVALEYDANAYTLDAQTTFPARPATSLPSPFTAAAPSGVNAVAGDDEAHKDRDGNTRPYIVLSWTASTDPYLSYYEVQYRRTGDPAWIALPNPVRTDLSISIGPVQESVGYDLQIRAVNTLGVPSAWVADTVTPNLQIVRVGSAWLDDMSTPLLASSVPGLGLTFGRRWRYALPGSTGNGSLIQVQDADALVGSHLMRITGPLNLEYSDNIPIDQNLLYVFRARVRQRKDPASGTKDHYIGATAVRQGTPGFAGGQTYVSTEGENTQYFGHYLLAKQATLAAGVGFTEYWGYIQGYAGANVPITGLLTNSGLSNYAAAQVNNGDLATIAFGTDAAVSGAFLRINFGAGTEVRLSEIWIYALAAGSTAQWTLEWADTSGGAYTAVATGLVFNQLGWNRAGFKRPVLAHQFWRLRLTNTPGAGPEFSELRVTDFSDEAGQPGSTLQNPTKWAPGATHFRPVIWANWDNEAQPNGEFDIDFMYCTLPAGFTPDLMTDEVRRRNDSLYDADGRLLPGVGQNDGTGDQRGLVKGMQRGAAYDTQVVTFVPVFQTVPVVNLAGGLTYQPNAGSWIGTYSTTVAQSEVLNALDLTVSGFTVQMRLVQYGVVTGVSNNAAGSPPPLITVVGGTDTLTLVTVGANDNKYTYRQKIQWRVKNLDANTASMWVKFAVDSSADGGANWTERTTVDYPASFNFGDSLFHTITADWEDFRFISGLSNVAPADQIRLRLISVHGDANATYDSSLTGVRWRNAASDGAVSLSYTTATDVICSKTPSGASLVEGGRYEAVGWI